jgi:hypothetical protein
MPLLGKDQVLLSFLGVLIFLILALKCENSTILVSF